MELPEAGEGWADAAGSKPAASPIPGSRPALAKFGTTGSHRHGRLWCLIHTEQSRMRCSLG